MGRAVVSLDHSGSFFLDTFRGESSPSSSYFGPMICLVRFSRKERSVLLSKPSTHVKSPNSGVNEEKGFFLVNKIQKYF